MVLLPWAPVILVRVRVVANLVPRVQTATETHHPRQLLLHLNHSHAEPTQWVKMIGIIMSRFNVDHFDLFRSGLDGK